MTLTKGWGGLIVHGVNNHHCAVIVTKAWTVGVGVGGIGNNFHCAVTLTKAGSVGGGGGGVMGSTTFTVL